MESFSARRPCRFCMGTQQDFQTKVKAFLHKTFVCHLVRYYRILSDFNVLLYEVYRRAINYENKGRPQ